MPSLTPGALEKMSAVFHDRSLLDKTPRDLGIAEDELPLGWADLRLRDATEIPTAEWNTFHRGREPMHLLEAIGLGDRSLYIPLWRAAILWQINDLITSTASKGPRGTGAAEAAYTRYRPEVHTALLLFASDEALTSDVYIETLATIPLTKDAAIRFVGLRHSRAELQLLRSSVEMAAEAARGSRRSATIASAVAVVAAIGTCVGAWATMRDSSPPPARVTVTTPLPSSCPETLPPYQAAKVCR